MQMHRQQAGVEFTRGCFLFVRLEGIVGMDKGKDSMWEGMVAGVKLRATGGKLTLLVGTKSFS